MGDVIPFTFRQDDDAGFELRVVTDECGEVWFVLVDVCRILALDNSRNASARLDEDEKGVHTMDTPGGRQEVTVVSEPGLYSLIRSSRKPAAKMFRRWVDHEVLPSIRKTGFYNNSNTAMSTQDVLLERITVAVEAQAQAVGFLATDVGTVKTDVACIRDEQKNQGIRIKAVEEVVRENLVKRKNFHLKTERQHTRCVGHVFHGLCPACNKTRIVTEDGILLPSARRDHYRIVNRPDLYHTWIICDECHDHRHRVPVDHFDPSFNNYQDKLRRFIDPGQLELFRRVA